MFLFTNLPLIIYTLFCILEFDPIQNVGVGVYTLEVARGAQSLGFHIVEAHPDEWYRDGEQLSEELEEPHAHGTGHVQGPQFSSVSSTTVKPTPTPAPSPRQLLDEYRVQSYAKAIHAGVRDNRQKSKKELQLGFEPTPPAVSETSGGATPKIVCYYNIPSMYDLPYAVFPEQIPPTLCTHIIIGFGRVLNSTLVPNDDQDLEFYARVVRLKEHNPGLKVMLAVGGAGSDNDNQFASMVKSGESRARFIVQAIEFLTEHQLDGLEIDWEWPAFEGPREQRDQLTDLLAEMQSAFKTRADQKKEPKLLLSSAVPAIKLVIDLGYDIPGIARAVDFVDVMCYDYHHYSLMTPLTGPNSPLFNASSEFGFFATLNLAWSSKYWYQNGMPADKIVVGMPTYGHSYELADSRYHGYYSVAKGFGALGSSGFVPYATVCQFLKNGTSLVMGDRSLEPYAYRDKEWISFDNEKSAKEKADFVKSMKFGGMMFYSLNSDDAWKSCKTSKTAFPIIQAAKDQFISSHGTDTA